MTDSAPQVIIIAGPNGAGKSTLAPVLLRDTLGLTEFVNADTIALGLSAYLPESVAIEAGRIMLKRLRALADRRVSFAFESTLSSRAYVGWLRQLRAQGYSIYLMLLWLRSPELAVKRVFERVVAGGHYVPEDVIRRRYRRGAHNFLNLYRALADAWVLYDNSPAGDLIVVASGSGSESTNVFVEDVWQQFQEAGRSA